MSKIAVIFIFIFLGTLLALGVANLNQNNSSVPLPNIAGVSQTSTPIPSPVKKVSLPQTLRIPKLGINAPIEQVGLDSEGKMDVPKKAANVGWYNLGFKPGENGNAVMAGHLDSITGEQAVFYNLSTLQNGDKIMVTDREGETLTFQVSDKQTYYFNQVPLQYVFGDFSKPRLNLITCDGAWDAKARNYSLRTIVYSELVD